MPNPARIVSAISHNYLNEEGKTMDWIAAAINLTGWYIMPKNKLAAACIFLMSNMIWINWAIGHTTWSIVLLQGCYVFLNIRAILIWQSPMFLFMWYVMQSGAICWGVFVAIFLFYSGLKPLPLAVVQ